MASGCSSFRVLGLHFSEGFRWFKALGGGVGGEVLGGEGGVGGWGGVVWSRDGGWWWWWWRAQHFEGGGGRALELMLGGVVHLAPPFAPTTRKFRSLKLGWCHITFKTKLHVFTMVHTMHVSCFSSIHRKMVLAITWSVCTNTHTYAYTNTYTCINT